MRTRTLRLALLAFSLVALMTPAFTQVQSQGCGGVNCVQPRVGLEQLDNQTATLFVAQNGAKLLYGQNSEDLVLSTGGTTTDTAGLLLPANAVILTVSGTVTTTISGGTCSGWQLGDPTTAGRFTANDTTLTQGEAKVGSVQITTGIASATTGIFQATAAKVRVTCATGAPGAGKVRITATYLQFLPPTI